MQQTLDTIRCPCTGDTLVRATKPRPEWKMPDAPLCDDCGFDDGDNRVREVRKIAACHLEDSWELFWSCPECDEMGDGDEIEWPFRMDEYSKAEDLEALGFKELW